jgi:carbon starvation protein
MTIWPMFGIANQILAVLALTLVTTWMVNHGRGKYAPVTILPMLFVSSTTLTASVKMLVGPFSAMISDGRSKVAAGQTAAGEKLILTGYLNSALTVFVVTCVLALLFWSAARWLTVWFKLGNPPNGGANGPATPSPKPEGSA